jgi:hypothetical protein
VEHKTQNSFHFDKISFYVIAHADDWQLFMHPNIQDDLMAPNCKIIFIVTTAGDAGKGERYWLAREEGFKSSVRFCFAHLPESSNTRTFNQHNIYCWSAGKTTSYFLRLPDGGLDGRGFSECNFQSLLKFKSGQLDSATTMDNAAKYLSWQDFTTTLESIISFESQDICNVWIHYLNPDAAINRDDHPDHVMTGLAVQNMSIITNLHQVLYMGYSLGSRGEHLPSNDFFWKAGMFAVYDKAVYDFCGYSTLREEIGTYIRWCGSKSEFITIAATSSNTIDDVLRH